MHIIHRKRTVKFAVLFLMMLTFAVIEDVLAAHLSGATLILETLPVIIVVSFVFTLITELVEERFEYGEQPLEHLLRVITHLERNNIPPTYENIKRHLRGDVDYMERGVGILEKKLKRK